MKRDNIANKNKGTVISHVSFRYSILVTVSIAIILLLALLLQSFKFISVWLPLIKDAVRSQEESGIQLQIELNAEEISVTFEQNSMFLRNLQNYADLLFQGDIPVEHYYNSYYEGIVADESESAVVKKHYNELSANALSGSTTSLEYSVWYSNNVSLYKDESTQYVNESTILDNVFRATYAQYPRVLCIYAGMQNGVLRVYPQNCLQTNFLRPYDKRKHETACHVTSTNSSRYEHRCDIWYDVAIRNNESVIFGKVVQLPDRQQAEDALKSRSHVPDYFPLMDENPNEELVDTVTLSKAIDGVNETIGVIGMDIKGVSEFNVVNIPILQNGYQFIIAADPDTPARVVVYHESCGELQRHTRCLLHDVEPALFSHSDIVEAIYSGYPGNASYNDDHTQWYITYTPISSTSEEGLLRLTLVGVVPFDDIESDYSTLKSRMQDFALYFLIACVCTVACVCFAMHHLSSFFFKTLVNPLHDFKSNAADFSENALQVQLGKENLSSSFKYKQMKQVSSSFQSLIYVLESVNLHYFSNHFELAYEEILLLELIFRDMENEAGLGVVLNNKGNILLKLFEIDDHEILALECFKEAVKIGHKVLEDFSKVDDGSKNSHARFRFLTLTLAGRYCNLGNYYQQVREHEEALGVYGMSVGLFTQAGDTLGKARAAGNIGHIYLLQRRRFKAKKVFEDAFQVAVGKYAMKPTNKRRELLQNASMNMGIFYRQGQKYEKARPYFVYALELSKNISKAVLYRCYSELVYIYHHSVDPRAQSMVTLLKNDKNFYQAVTPRSIYFVLEVSEAMTAIYNNDKTSLNSIGDSFRSIKSESSDVEMLNMEKYSRLGFAKDCITFIIKSCLTGNDFVSLTLFDQKISKKIVNQSLQEEKDSLIDYMDKFINEENCSGACAVYDALQNTLISVYGNRMFSNFDSWIVVFTSGNDDASTRSLEEMEDMLMRINVNYIIVSLDTGQVAAKPQLRSHPRASINIPSSETMGINVGNHSEADELKIQIPIDDPLTQKVRRKSSTEDGADEEDEDTSHPMECLFHSNNKRKCLHLNSKVMSSDKIRYLLFSAFEEIEINVSETVMESVL